MAWKPFIKEIEFSEMAPIRESITLENEQNKQITTPIKFDLNDQLQESIENSSVNRTTTK